MLNLIPPQGRKLLRNEYFIRVFSVYAFLFSAVFIAGATLLVPTYVLVSSQLTVVEQSAEDSQAFEIERSAAESLVRESNTTNTRLWINNETTPFSSYINEVNAVAGSDIVFKTFQLSEKDGVITSFQAQGIAKSRATLTQFIDVVESLPTIESASVPVSDLARDVDLPFVMSIVVSKQE